LDSLASRRDLIKNFLPVVRVTKGKPGKHGLDPNRVELCGRPKGDVAEQIAAYTRALAEVNTTVPRIN
jgi:hypothetical protein